MDTTDPEKPAAPGANPTNIREEDATMEATTPRSPATPGSEGTQIEKEDAIMEAMTPRRPATPETEATPIEGVSTPAAAAPEQTAEGIAADSLEGYVTKTILASFPSFVIVLMAP